MAKKIKALELNQSMFDRYVEASIARVAERLDDVSADVEAAEEIAANATAASLRAEAKANAAKDTSQLEEASKTARVVLEKIETRANALEHKLAALEREMSRVTPRIERRSARRCSSSPSRRRSSPPSRFSTPPRRSLLILLGTQKRTTARPVVTPRSRRSLLGLQRIRPRVSASTGWTEPPGRRRRTDRRIVRVRRAVSRTAEHSAGEFGGECVRLPSIDSRSFLRSTRVFIEGLGASKQEARTARLVAGIGALAIAALCAFCGCGLLVLPPAKVAFATAARGPRRGVAWTHRVFSLARKIDPVGLARAGGGFVKAFVERFERWRLGGGGG